MNQTPWWIAIVIGLFSGGLGATLTYSLNYRKERSQFLRERAEQLYVCLDAYGRWVSTGFITAKISSEADWSQSYDSTEISEAITNYRKTFALCNVYFPHIMPALNNILDSRDRLNATLAKVEAGEKESADQDAMNFEELLEITKEIVSKQCRHPLTEITYFRILSAPWN